MRVNITNNSCIWILHHLTEVNIYTIASLTSQQSNLNVKCFRSLRDIKNSGAVYPSISAGIREGLPFGRQKKVFQLVKSCNGHTEQICDL